jgi:beta-galactosidase
VASFSIGDTDFLLDGSPHRIISGAIHYFRVHPDQWADRIRKARLMGLNAIETYVAWNAHEPRRGEWDASGWNDLGAFLDAVGAEGMHAIVRPGPYICAEWHNGGLPVWLTRAHNGRLRSSDPAYVADVSEYLRRVYEIVAPRQIDRGGNVILVQIENEYGAYGADKEYLSQLVRVTRDAGITVPLTTVDQPVPRMLQNGTLPELHATGSFGSHADERLATLRAHQPSGPLMCSEFWDGWFDWWGGHHHTTSAAAAAGELDALLAAGASVNIYMFHGGTNFGLTNGANDKGRYLPLVTSYDYDAPLDESGDPTEKYWALRDVIAKYAPVPEDRPSAASARPVISVALETAGDWLRSARADRTALEPPTFEDLDHASALVLYETDLPAGDQADGVRLLSFDEVRDQAWVTVDGRPVGTISRTRGQRSLPIPAGHRLGVLVEEQGRVNYATKIGEPKGLIGIARLGDDELVGWSVSPIDLAAVACAAAKSPLGLEAAADEQQVAGPVAARGRFALDEQSDLFLDTKDWGKGFAFVNGFLLGRYWSAGPQRTLYVPSPITRAGENIVVVVELEQLGRLSAEFVGHALLGPTEE